MGYNKNTRCTMKRMRNNKPANKKNKLHVKFDTSDRREYLKGFGKRKTERKQRAAKQIEDEIKNEKKRIRQERRDIVKKIMYTADDDEEEEEVEEYDITQLQENTYVGTCGDTTVEISDINLNSSKYHLGLNKMVVEKEKEKEKKKDKKKDEKENKDEEEEDVSKDKLASLGINSEKMLFRSLQKSSASILKKNKLVQMKQRAEGKKQRKQQMRVKKSKEAYQKK